MGQDAPQPDRGDGEDDAAALRRVLAAGSRSFSLAGRLMHPDTRDDAAAVYAFCRRADDAIDEAPPGEAPARLAGLRAEIEALYASGEPRADGALADDLALRAFALVARRRRIPRVYLDELVHGMEMDVRGTRYRTERDLVLYCYRVASVVGLMMCHVMGVKDDAALGPAAHLGVALQMTNIARDVAEDWGMGRLYLPQEWLGEWGEKLAGRLDARVGEGPTAGEPLPTEARGAIAEAVRKLLTTAERHYRRADAGLAALPLQSALAIRAARWIYRGIGSEVAARGHAVWEGRAVVSGRRKGALLAWATALEARQLPARLRAPRGGRVPTRVVASPWEVLGEGEAPPPAR